MKGFEEKAIKNMSDINGGKFKLYLTAKITGLLDGEKGNTKLEGDAKISIGKAKASPDFNNANRAVANPSLVSA